MNNTDDTISRAGVIPAIESYYEPIDPEQPMTLTIEQIAEVINALPSVPPQVAHGRWIRVDDWTDECTECGHATEQDIEDRSDYCPDCGAKMDGDENDAAN